MNKSSFLDQQQITNDSWTYMKDTLGAKHVFIEKERCFHILSYLIFFIKGYNQLFEYRI